MSTVTFDTSRFTAKVQALREKVRDSAAAHLPDAAYDALLRAGYGDAAGDEVSAYADLSELVTAPNWAETTVAVGIITIYDWGLDPDRRAHCPTCVGWAEGGPYRREQLTEQPYQGEDLGLPLVHSHQANNPCHCVLEKRELDLRQAGIAALRETAAPAIGADLEATWTSR